ncbi:unnamed protein product [Kluyveromyces dobzhanskii CBS 2104]|uniref:WGS project CCBQ000000000 data, contig 00058 n=1 Tax=Kluyveromyces dobzhanskii CBS 2104 TaxID=1427455 RepID=A0A0A8LBC5_9SACH|nr:unnamed protein product [Kluyveromyces dobzhanskii CBS 2104]
MSKFLQSIIFFFLSQLVLGANSEVPSLVVGTDYSGLYYVNSTFGSPGQEQRLRVDLSQPYMWVVSGEIYPECNKLGSGCLSGSLYYPLQSTTSEQLSDAEYVRLEFLDLISINGSKYNDNMNFTTLSLENNGTTVNDTNVLWDAKKGWLSVNDTSFIVANETGTLIHGALGLSGQINTPASDPVSSLNFDDSYYFLKQLKNAGVIETSSYSLWVNNATVNDTESKFIDDDAGRLLLGGVDPKYYTGDLISFSTIPFKDEDSGYLSTGYPIVPMSKISISNSDQQAVNLTDSDFLQPVFLHSRYLYSYLPLSLIIQVSIQTNAVYVESLDRWLVACDIGDMGSNVVFEFGNLNITVPTADFLGTTYSVLSNSSLHFVNGKEACYLKMYPNYATSFSVLGQSFIKNAYIAHDLENGNIALAQAASPDEVESASGKKSAKKFESSTIPYAVTNNITNSLTMSNSMTTISSDLLNKYTATIASDGEIFTGRSFYDTSRTTTADGNTSSGGSNQSTTSNSSGTPSAAAARIQNHFSSLSIPNFNIWGLSLALIVCGFFGLSLVF